MVRKGEKDMWTDLEMLIMSLCCLGVGLCVGADLPGSRRKRRR